MRAICICTSDRPDRLQACLQSLQENDHDLEGWKLYIGVEPMNDEILLIIEAIRWIKCEAMVWPRRLGPTLNTFMVYNMAFSDGAKAALYLDDDMIVSPDAIDLCNWYLSGELSWGPREAGLCLCNNHENNPHRPNSIATNLAWVGLVGQGYCITAAQWFNWVKRIFFTYKPHFGGDDYDWAIAHTAIDERRRILRPRFSRSQHTGVTGYHGEGKIFPDQINGRRQPEFVIEEI